MLIVFELRRLSQIFIY